MSWFFSKKKTKPAAKVAKVVAGSLVAAAAPAAHKVEAPRPPAKMKAQAAQPLTRHQSGFDRFIATFDVNRKLGSSPREAMQAAFQDLDGQMGHVIRRGRVLKVARRALWETLS